MATTIKLVFTCDNGKRCYQNVPLEVADTIPLFANSGISDFSPCQTTFSALSLYWKCYKRQNYIPMNTPLQERIDFIELAEYLGENLFDEWGYVRRDVYCEANLTMDDMEIIPQRYYKWDDTVNINIRSNGNIIDIVPCWINGTLRYSLLASKCDRVRYFENGRLIDIYTERREAETTFDLARKCETIFDLLPSIPRKWHRNLPLENCDVSFIRNLLLCFRRVLPKRMPAEVLGIILKDYDFYEDWNRIVFDQLPKSVTRYLMNSYYDNEFLGAGGEMIDRINRFVTTWPQMANLVWKTMPREEMADTFNIPRRKRAGFLAAKTPNELLLYYSRLGRRTGTNREEELMMELMNARTLTEEIKCQERLDRYRRGNRLIGRADASIRRLYK